MTTLCLTYAHHKIPRTVPLYQFWKWDKKPCYSSVPDRAACIQKVKLYHEFYKKYTDIRKQIQVNEHDLGILLYFVGMLMDNSTNTMHVGLLTSITKTTLGEDTLYALGTVLCPVQMPIRFIQNGSV